MALNIRDSETERLAMELAQKTGENVAMAVRRALEDRLRRVGNSARREIVLEELAASRKRFGALPLLDNRSPDEILGYDDNGVPSR